MFLFQSRYRVQQEAKGGVREDLLRDAAAVLVPWPEEQPEPVHPVLEQQLAEQQRRDRTGSPAGGHLVTAAI